MSLFLLFSAIAYLPGIRTPCALAHTQTRDSTSRAITFTERVAYQNAIEEVHWRHRIWPTDNLGPKPALDAVVSREQMEQKVQQYLRKSQQVADQRGSPITANELQAEMDRMASYTHQPNILRELFAALGNDPFLIAECLARPILADRLTSGLTTDRGSLNRPSSFANDAARSVIAPFQSAYALPEIADDCADDSWTATANTNVPDSRRYHTTIWTGDEMIIWGGYNTNGGQVNTLNTGGRYNPATDTWIATSTTNAPLGRDLHSAVWTGSEMIIWGGENYPVGILSDGGKYNPATNTWVTVSIANAPIPREQHRAVWTGSEMIIWGGRDWRGWYNSGGRYNPDTDSWIATSILNAPERRWSHTAEWTGNEMIIWGGSNQTILLNTGGKYNPVTDNWTATSTATAPLGRAAHTSIWSGSEMIVWGGADSDLNDLDTGGRYNPTTDSWVATNLNNAPSRRDSHTAVWTGDEMIVWGGVWLTSPPIDFNTGGRYNPSTDGWTATGTMNVPHARDSHTAVWTGDKMIVWGGGYYIDNSHFTYLNTGGTYCAQASPPLVQSVVSRKTHSFAGVYDIVLPLSGTPGVECRSGGATNDNSILVRFTANVTVNGNPQAAVTSGLGTIGSNGVPNGGQVVIAGNLVTVPLTNVANAQTIQITLYGVNGSTDITIPMSILIGDTNGNGTVNAGDVAQTKGQSGAAVTGANFRTDVNANGSVNAGDIALVKANSGHTLP